MRILLLTQWCHPEPDLKSLTFAKEIRRQGHEVSILTGFPNYPGGKLYPGYRVRTYLREEIDGITIHRVPLYPSHSRSRVGRVANYVSFALSAATLGPLVTEQVDVIYAYHPPATVSFSALALKLLKRVPVVYDIQDMWPDTLAATGMLTNPRILRLIGVYCRHSYRFLDHIVVLSHGFKRRLIEEGVDADRISVIRNWALDMEFDESSAQEKRKRLGWEQHFVILFAGNIGTAQQLGTVLDAAKQLPKDSPILFSFLGDGVALPELKRRVEAESIGHVQFLPRVPPSEVGNYLFAADALLVHLKDDPLFAITIPSKIQSYLRVGRPILAGVPGEASELVTQARAGLAFQPENARDLLDKARHLAGLSKSERVAMQENARAFYAKELSLEIATKRFLRLFASLTSDAKARTTWRGFGLPGLGSLLRPAAH